MTDADRDLYRATLDPWVRRAEREGKVITHVVYREGRADVTLEPRKRHESVADSCTGPLL